jgi:hypothetical protein
MLTKNTVFVIGAGASKEYDLPVSSELNRQIIEALAFEFDAYERVVHGDAAIVQALKDTAQSDRELKELDEACRQIREALPLHYSIDNLIDNHKHNGRIAFCGKLAIAQSILRAESASKLQTNRINSELQSNSLENTWLNQLFLMMQEGVPRDRVAGFFRNCKFVVFNYDRCIEHFFYHALQRAYILPQSEVVELIQSAPIVHVYGSLGTPDWQGTGAVPFGQRQTHNLLQCASNIKTFTELVESDTLAQVREWVAESHALVFLGFGFHPRNLDVLRRPEQPFANTQLAIGSAKGISKLNCGPIEQSIRSMFRFMDLIKVQLDADVSAGDFLKNYGKLITA